MPQWMRTLNPASGEEVVLGARRGADFDQKSAILDRENAVLVLTLTISFCELGQVRSQKSEV